MKLLRAVVLALLVLVVLLTLAWNLRPFFVQNHVTFLLNQKEISAARQRLEKLNQKFPDSSRSQFLTTKIQVISGAYTKAVRGSEEPWSNDYPEIYYWLAIAEFQLGHVTKSRNYAARYLKSNHILHSTTAMQIASGLAGEKIDSSPVDSNLQDIQMLFPVETAIYFALVGESLAENGNFETATQAFNKAFALGLRNSKVLEVAVNCAAMSGKVQSAEMFLAFCDQDLSNSLFGKYLNSYQKDHSGYMAINPYGPAGRGGRLQLAHALAWSGLPYLRVDTAVRKFEVLKTVSDLQQEYPFDAVLKMRMAETLEYLDRNQEAHAIYKALNDERPTLVTSLRMWALEHLSEDKITSLASVTINALHTLQTISASHIPTGKLSPNGNFVSCSSNDNFSVPLEIVQSGNFLCTVICRGYQQNGKWPLVTIALNENHPVCQYVSRQDWDCYSFAVTLDKGPHEVKLSYRNPADNSSSASAIQNLEIRSIFVTDTGVN